MTRLLGLVLFALALGAGTDRAAAAGVEFLNSEAGKALGLPFSEATRAGGLLFLSGQIGNLPGTFKLVEGGVGPETEQTLNNIQAILERHGSSLDKVAKCTVFLADIAEWPAVNEVYRKFFGPEFPARSAVAGSGLAIGARVEIECIAAAP